MEEGHEKSFFSVTPSLGTIGGGEINLKKFIKFLCLKNEIDKITIAYPDIQLLKDFWGDIGSAKVEFINYHFDTLTVDKNFLNLNFYRLLRTEKQIVEKKVKKENYDLIFAHAPTDVLILKNFLERTNVIFYSNIPSHVRIWPFKLAIKKYIGKLNNVICVSEFLQNKIKSILPSKKNIYMIHNGVEDINLKSNPPVSVKNIGVVARFEKEKNVILAIRVFRILVKKYGYLSLHLFGDGSKKKAMEDFVTRNEIKNVYFHNFVKNTDEIYSKIDLLVVPSKMEALSLVIIEAMSRNIPVVASNVGGIPEIIKDGYNGLLAEPNVRSFVTKITKIIENPQLISAFAKNYAQTLAQFDIEKKFEDLYKILFDQT
ncbi:MAG: glycosyltransferase family 4 protein [Thermotogae bacterium]|jgi:glycosyltransferase involved in cell wall biosynthesis|nr:glycosyltransferase family 4 protein [Thermotogota bacterium]MCL5032897.1 glycosyltransferase family 4 protein [Thermotogota bacterium]